MTHDGGRTWRDITPPGLRDYAKERPDDPAGVEDMFFLDEHHGWVLASDCAGPERPMYITTNGGRTWRSSPALFSHTCNAGARETVDFADTKHGWVVDFESTGPGADLQTTVDGGATWTEKRQLGGDAHIVGFARFRNANYGIAAGGGEFTAEPPAPNTGVTFFTTADAGTTWTSHTLDRPPGHETDNTLAQLPSFFGDDAVLPVFMWRKNPTNGPIVNLGFYRTTDAGSTWTFAGFAPTEVISDKDMYLSADGPLVTAIASPRIWWVAGGTNPRAVVVTRDSSKTWTTRTAPIAAQSITAADDQEAWITGRYDTGGLFATYNGGRTWKNVTP